MKKLILILLVFATVAALAQEKEPKETKFNFGVGAGYSASCFMSKGSWRLEELLYRPTFKAIVEYKLSDKFKLKSGLSYKQKGKSRRAIPSISGAPIEYDFHKEFHYIELPLLFSFHSSGKTKFYVNAGFFVAANIFSNTCSKYYYLKRKPFDDNLKTIDLGGVLGIGMTIPVGSKYCLDIGLSDFKGLINCEKDYKGVTTNSIEFLVALKTR